MARKKRTKKSKIQTRSKKEIKRNKKNRVRSSVQQNLTNSFHRTKIRVIGIGGGGSSVVAEIAPAVKRADFWAANTDMQALKRIGKNCRHFLFGQSVTAGLGCGASPRLGQAAAEKAKDKIAKLFEGVDLVILISCLGGGTGSGAMPEFARQAREANCLSLGIFTLPFKFEGEKKTQVARIALSKAVSQLSASVIFPNEKIFQLADKPDGFQSALSKVNSILAEDLKNLIETVYAPGLINIDFSDLRSVLAGEGKMAYLASASSQEQNKVEDACKVLMSHPLNEYDPSGAGRILFNIASEKDISIDEVEHISKIIYQLNPSAKIIFGLSSLSPVKNKGGNRLTVTLLAVGDKKEDRGKEKSAKSKGPRRNLKIKRVKVLTQAASSGATKPQEGPKRTGRKTPKKILSNRKTAKNPAIKKSVSAANASPVIQKIKSKHLASKKKQSRTTKGKNIVLKKQEISRVEDGLLSRMRKNALDLRKEVELAEEEHLAQERQWDIPAFLRRAKNS